MTNMSYEEEQWYPKLPEGYSEEATGMHGQGMDGWMPGANMQDYGMSTSYMGGMDMPNYEMNDWMTGMATPHWGGNSSQGMNPHDPPGFPPGMGGPGFPGPGFPGGGFPGGGFPGGGFPGGGFPGGGFPGGGFPGGGFPGGGFPGGGFPGGGFPGGGAPGGQQAPTAPPPNFTPTYPGGNQAQLLRVDPGAIRGCLFRFTYVWTSRRNGFWYFPTFVGRTSVAGYRWSPSRRRWEYFGIDLNRIDQFTCF